MMSAPSAEQGTLYAAALPPLFRAWNEEVYDVLAGRMTTCATACPPDAVVSTRVALCVPSGAAAKPGVARTPPNTSQFASPMRSGDSNRFSAGTALGRGFTASAAVRAVPRMFAEMVTSVLAPTSEVPIGKVAFAVPAGTVTLCGTVAAAGLLLERGTDKPPLGAWLASVTLPCALSPPNTTAGLSVNESTAGATVTKPALVALPPRPSKMRAEMVNRVLAVTAGGVKTTLAPLPLIVPPSA